MFFFPTCVLLTDADLSFLPGDPDALIRDELFGPGSEGNLVDTLDLKLDFDLDSESVLANGHDPNDSRMDINEASGCLDSFNSSSYSTSFGGPATRGTVTLGDAQGSNATPQFLFPGESESVIHYPRQSPVVAQPSPPIFMQSALPQRIHVAQSSPGVYGHHMASGITVTMPRSQVQTSRQDPEPVQDTLAAELVKKLKELPPEVVAQVTLNPFCGEM